MAKVNKGRIMENMIQKVNYNRLKEILPTFNTRVVGEIVASSYTSQSGYISGFIIKTDNGLISYDIFCFDIDPRYRDDEVLRVIQLLKDNNVEIVYSEKTVFSYAQNCKSLFDCRIGE